MGRRLKFLQKLGFLGQDHRYQVLEKGEVETLIEEQNELKAIEKEKAVAALTPREASKCSKEDLARAFHVDLDSGLSEFAVAQRRLVHGWNEFLPDNVEPMWKKYLDQFRNPLILLLLGSAAVSVLTKEYEDAISITLPAWNHTCKCGGPNSQLQRNVPVSHDAPMKASTERSRVLPTA